MSRSRQVLALSLAALVVMGWGVAGEFVYDAAAIVLRDGRLEPPIDWSAMFTQPYWPTGLWRPLTLGLFGLEVLVAGEAVPLVFQVASLLLYMLVSVMLLRCLFILGIGSQAAFVVALLFVAHPIHVEVVSSIVGQAELLSTAAMLAAVLIWHRAGERGISGTTVPLLLAAQAAAIMAKEQGFVLPVLLVGQFILLPGRLSRTDAIRLLTPVGLLALLLLVFRASVAGSIAGETPALYLAALDTPARLVAAIGVLPDVARLLLIPIHLQGEYGPPAIPADGILGLRFILGLVLIGGWGVLLWRWRRRRPIAALGMLWVAVTWLPSSSIIAPAGVMLAERLLFLPTVGLALVVAGLATDWSSFSARGIQILMMAVLTLFAARSIQRTAVWRDDARFFSQLTMDAPEVYQAWYIRGVHARDVGDLRAAEQHQVRALELWRADPAVFEELGQVRRAQGHCDTAISVLQEGLALNPMRVQMRSKLGECLLTVGDSMGAAALAREALDLGDTSFRLLLERSGGR